MNCPDKEDRFYKSRQRNDIVIWEDWYEWVSGFRGVWLNVGVLADMSLFKCSM